MSDNIFAEYGSEYNSIEELVSRLATTMMMQPNSMSLTGITVTQETMDKIKHEFYKRYRIQDVNKSKDSSGLKIESEYILLATPAGRVKISVAEETK
jgi:hypothetical protein